jgi:telomere length regulation protein
MSDVVDQVQDVIHQLRLPVPNISTLISLLCSPLDRIGLLPLAYKHLNVNPLQDSAEFSIVRYIPPLQRALLEHIVPTWQPVLVEQNALSLLEQYFCPAALSLSVAGQVALLAYPSILSLTFSDYSIQLLARLFEKFPIDRLYFTLFFDVEHSSKLAVSWEDHVRNVVVVPAKVANIAGGKGFILPILEQGAYFNALSVQCETLIYALSSKSCPGT